MKLYRVEVVGGKYDGISGLYWSSPVDDAETRPPMRIAVGTCPGDGSCAGGSTHWCAQAGKLTGGGVRAPHPSYWTSEEGYAPPDAQFYRRSKVVDPAGPCNCCQIGGHAPECDSMGRAVYGALGAPLADPEAEKALTVDDILRAAPPVPATFAGASAGAMEAARQLVHLGQWLRDGRHDRGWPK